MGVGSIGQGGDLCICPYQGGSVWDLALPVGNVFGADPYALFGNLVSGCLWVKNLGLC